MPSKREVEGVAMDELLWSLRQAKRLPADELESLVKKLSPQFAGRVDALRDLVGVGNLVSVRRGKRYDAVLIRTALVAIVLADVYPFSPYVKEVETENIASACKGLGISYEDVLEMTAKERQVVAALGASE